jgi:hypothetical protein
VAKTLHQIVDFCPLSVLQTQMVAAAAAGVVAGGLSPRAAKAEADVAAYLSMSLAENAIVLLMLVEDHLRLQCQIFNPSLFSAPASGPASPRAFMPSQSLLGLSRTSSDGAEVIGSRRFSTTNDGGGVSLDVSYDSSFCAFSAEKYSSKKDALNPINSRCNQGSEFSVCFY